MQLSILMVGAADSPEFAEAAAPLDQFGRVTAVPNVEVACARLAAGAFFPEVVVLVESRPGEISHEAVDRLRRLAPLARFVGLMGSWCEGETRSGAPWPAVERVYWHQWAPRIARELERLTEGRCPTWGLPVTATEEERLLSTVQEEPPRRQGLVVIETRWFEMAECLSAACRDRGYHALWRRPEVQPAETQTVEVEKGTDSPAEKVAAVIWEGACCDDLAAADLRRLAAEFPGVPLAALFDFPRAFDRDRALAAGATCVVSKPVVLEEVFRGLERRTDSS
ncbi:MAG: hypothetical protein ACYC35_22650 [Pirellulales bacterium]